MILDRNPVLKAVKAYSDAAEQIFAAKDELITSLETQLQNAGLTGAQLAEAIEQVSALQAQLVAMRENMTAAPDTARIAALEGELAAAKTNAANWRKAKQEAQTEANVLRQQVADFAAKEAEYTAEVAGYKTEVAALEAKIKKLGG